MEESGYRKFSPASFFMPLLILFFAFMVAVLPVSDAWGADVNMKKVSLEVTSGQTFYKKSSKDPSTFVVEMKVKGGGKHVFNKKTDFCDINIKASKAYKNRVFLQKIKMSKNILKVYLSVYDTAKINLGVTINGKDFDPITIRFFTVDMIDSMNLTAGSSSDLAVFKCMVNSKKKYTGKIKWSSSDEDVATVDSKGKVTAKDSGKATITAKVGTAKLKCKVSVSKATNTSSSKISKTVTVNSNGSTGEKIAAYALQFIGCPYVYGGNDLDSGIDCSGLIQQVYFHFGYNNIPRTSQDQAWCGTAVAVELESLLPGDLLFYGSIDDINHVAIYIGGGQIVHASTSGVKVSPYNYEDPVCARRLI